MGHTMFICTKIIRYATGGLECSMGSLGQHAPLLVFNIEETNTQAEWTTSVRFPLLGRTGRNLESIV